MFELGEKFEEIENYTVMAIEEFPEKAEFWFFDGTSKLAQKKYLEAETSLLKALEQNNGTNKQLDILVGGQLGDTYHSLKKKEKAYEAYDKVLAQSPDNEHILNNYAYFLSLDKNKLDKAKNMSEKLVKKFPKNATYLDTHAWVLFQRQDYDDAQVYMKQALDNQADPSGVMYEHYGDILYKLGNKKEALDYWKKAEGSEEASDLLNKKIKNLQYYE
jgi:tetratricopeptide (TPR) repeat protein